MSKDITIYFSSKEQVISSGAAALAAAFDYAKNHQILLPSTTRLLKTPSGKPHLTNPKIKLSISHSGKYWLAACSVAELGIDLQQHVDCRREALSRRFFHPDEYRWLKSQDCKPFFSLWAAKESYAKYTGAGISVFKSFSLVNKQGIVPKIGRTKLQIIPFRDGYTLALCAETIDEIIFKEDFLERV